MQQIIYPIYEFILWDNCNNNCKFCFQTQKRFVFNKKQKQLSIKCIEKKLSELTKKCNILFVGGEIFDDDSIQLNILNLFKYIVDLKRQGLIEYIYLNTNILYTNMNVLFLVLDIFNTNNIIQYVKFTTSYDEFGRFINTKQIKIFINNLILIKQRYSMLNIIINSILTKQLCDAILNGSSRLYSLFNKCSFINLLPYIINDTQLIADKHIIFQALIKINTYYNNYLNIYIKNLNLKQHRFIYKYNSITDSLDYITEDNSDCGHCLNFKRYSHDNTCFVCDVNNIFNDFI